MMSLFGKKKEKKAPTTQETLQLLADNIALLEKKNEHLQTKIASETKFARENASKNKRAAMAALKRKKLYENQANKLLDTITTLQQQEITLQNLSTNMEVLHTFNQVKETMKGVTNNLTVDDVDQTMDDVREQMDMAEELSNAISTPMGNALFDEDELEAELQALEDEDIDAKLAGLDKLPSAPVVQQQQQQQQLPMQQQPLAVPAGKGKIDDELDALEKEMMI